MGMAYHFRKVHGEPRLVLSARHEDVGRGVSAVIWAALCLVLAAAAVQTLRRPDAVSWMRRRWPVLAVIVGLAWLFLLPAGAAAGGGSHRLMRADCPRGKAVGWVEVARTPGGAAQTNQPWLMLCALASQFAATEAPPEHRFA